MKFKIKQTWPNRYSGAAYQFRCPLCSYFTPKNMNPDFVKEMARDHIAGEHYVSFARIEFVIKGLKHKKCKPQPKTVVLVRHRTPQGNELTSLVDPTSGQDPVTFARWAAKEFPDNTYTLHSYLPVKTELIK